MTTAPALEILTGDSRDVLTTLPDESVHCCVTSPPYWGLRSYLPKGHPDKHREIGQEKTPEAFVQTMVEIFREVRRVLRKDGTCWVNLGDSYAGYHGNKNAGDGPSPSDKNGYQENMRESTVGTAGLKAKDLVGIPWRVALALQADGWYLRQDIIWAKPNPMPESVQDRCTKSHEYIFMLTKAPRYFYDAEAIKENVTGGAHRRSGYKTPDGWDTAPGAHGTIHRNGREKGHTDYIHTPRSFKGSVPGRKDGPGQDRRSANDRGSGITPKSAPAGSGIKANDSFQAAVTDLVDKRNKRSVWTVGTFGFPEAHFATFPPDLIKPCILAGCPVGGTVLDPFGGSGTTGQVALELGRSAVLIELNPEYAAMCRERCNITPGLPLQ